MNRREALKKAWAKLPRNFLIWPPPSNYEAGFNTGWDALLSEIRPLVADLRTHTEISQRQISGESWLSAATADAKAIKRLRELVREVSDE